MKTEEPCIVCGGFIKEAQDGPHASWGPITLYFHYLCIYDYEHRIAPRLRDALQRTLTRWRNTRKVTP